MLRVLKEIEGDTEASYLRFTNFPVVKTKQYANGEVNVDLDAYDEVVGIEMLCWEPEELQALGEIARTHQLDLTLLSKCNSISQARRQIPDLSSLQ